MPLSLRAATRDDAKVMAMLVDMAGEGLPRALWARQAGYGEDPMEFGAKRIGADEGAMSWRNATLAMWNDQTAGLVITDDLADVEVEMSSDTHPILRPLIRLENLARGTRTLAVLSVFRQFRRHGIATALLEKAEHGIGRGGMSTIITDRNAAARAFLVSAGYAANDRLPLVRGDWETASEAWVLMRK